MEAMMIPTIGFVAVTLLAALGVHIAIVMGFLGLAGVAFYSGFDKAISLAGLSSWFNVSRFSIAMIPLFVLMGTLCARGGIGAMRFRCFDAWFRRVRGSLAIVSVSSCAAFAALTGSSTATVATIGAISVPEMAKRNYSKPLRLGSVAVAGTLGILIPPSVIMIFYGVLTEVSIGKLFVAGVIPGLLTWLMFCGLISVWVRVNPKAAPESEDGETYTLIEKLRLTLGIAPILLVFAAVTFSIYAGICSPEEAAAYGVLAVILVIGAMGRLRWDAFKAAIIEALTISGFICFILMGAMLFANAVALSGFPIMLQNLVESLQVPPYQVMLIIIAIYLVLGCVLDTFGLMVLTVPILFPVVTHLGYDPIWFGVLVTVLVECALVTPPVGTNIYVAAGLEPGSNSLDVIRGVGPFLLVELLLIGLMLLFPEMVTWLPSHMA